MDKEKERFWKKKEEEIRKFLQQKIDELPEEYKEGVEEKMKIIDNLVDDCAEDFAWGLGTVLENR
ncbi:MAG: hypothetical protein ACOCRX_06285 [Candidatus Woesearchaeota archaeon]